MVFPPVTEGGLMLVWLSFFLKGGFIFLDDANTGSYSIFSTLLGLVLWLIVVSVGLLIFFDKLKSSEMI